MTVKNIVSIINIDNILECIRKKWYKLILIFESAKDDNCVIATVATQEQAMQEIRDFCEKRDFEIRYFRAWKRENVKYFNVGSWYERFRLELEDGEIWQD